MSSETILVAGSYSFKVPYHVEQLRYGYTDCEANNQGFAWLLWFKDPPAGHHGAIIYTHWDSEKISDWLYEFSCKAAALDAWTKSMYREYHLLDYTGMVKNRLLSIPGLLHYEELGSKLPWFWSKG